MKKTLKKAANASAVEAVVVAAKRTRRRNDQSVPPAHLDQANTRSALVAEAEALKERKSRHGIRRAQKNHHDVDVVGIDAALPVQTRKNLRKKKKKNSM
jgi:hypothetical protein